MNTIVIGNKKIQYGALPYVIAEAGVNHNGRLPIALRLIDAAADAGADAIKFQTFEANQVTIANTAMAPYQKKNTQKNQSQFEMLKKLELKKSFYLPIIQHCKKRKIRFLSTPHGSFSSVQFLQSLHVDAFKFGSGDLNNFPVLSFAAKFGKPIIIGTGMSTIKEVLAAIRCIYRTGNKQVIALHATTNYPCPLNEVNMRAMQTMMKALPCLVGYSDHTMGIETSVAAYTLGACMIEKHFTLDTTMAGPDHKASATPKEISALVSTIKKVNTLLGSDNKGPNASEQEMMRSVRKSIVSTKKISVGEKFTENNLGIKRPGTGLAPIYYFSLIGKRSRRTIKPDALISKHDYEQ